MKASPIMTAKENCGVEFRPRQAFPKVGKDDVLACDFHMHTTCSDGTVSPRNRVYEAYRQGYDAIAIADHGTTEAYDDAINLAHALGMILIRAFETGLGGNAEHFVVLNAPAGYAPVDAHWWGKDRDLPAAFYRDQLEEVAKFGGLVIYAHPHMGYREPVLWGVRQGLIQAIEVKNGVVGTGWNTVPSHGCYCYPAAFPFALKNHLAILANTDSHGPRTPTCEISYVLVKDRSVTGILDAIRARRTFAGFDGMVWGPQKLLASVFKAGVTITEAESDARYVRIHNRCPITLRVSRPPSAAMEIGPCREAVVKVDDAASGLPWVLENVWIDLENHLTLPVEIFETHPLFIKKEKPPTDVDLARRVARKLVDEPAVANAATSEQFAQARDAALEALVKQQAEEIKPGRVMNPETVRLWAAKVIPAFRTATPPAIDGRLDEAVWRSAVPGGDFAAYTSGKPVATRTRFAVCYDETNLYLGIWCDQDQAELAAVVPADRNALDRNSVEIFLGREMAENEEAGETPVWQIVVSRGGQAWDGYHNGLGGWKPEGLRCAGSVTANQWTLELAVPWHEIGLDPAKHRVSLLNVVRNRCRQPAGDDEISTWFLSASAHMKLKNRGYLRLMQDAGNSN